MATELQTMEDAQVLRTFRDLFAATLDEVESTGISRSTWVRIESGQERTHRPGVQQRLNLIRARCWRSSASAPTSKRAPG